jgi:hypothetical protein
MRIRTNLPPRPVRRLRLQATPSRLLSEEERVMDRLSKDEFRAVANGAAAWQRLRETRSFDDWMQVGLCLSILRDAAMKAAHIDRPIGATYNYLFGWMCKNLQIDIAAADTNRLFLCMDSRPDIERFRLSIPRAQMLKLNSPHAVLKAWTAWKAAQQQP